MDSDEILLAKIGLCLIQLQRVEHTLSVCIAAMPNLSGIDITSDALLNKDSRKRKYTLGQLLSPLKSQLSLGVLEDRLTLFLKYRNDFIHNHWILKSTDWPIKEPEYSAVSKFVTDLTLEAIAMERIFRGLFGVVVEITVGKIDVDITKTHPKLLPWLEERRFFYDALVLKKS